MLEGLKLATLPSQRGWRMIFAYGWEDGRLGVPPGSSAIKIDLVVRR